jgi:hypothetical protein
MNCKDCIHWERNKEAYLGLNRGICKSPKFIDISSDLDRDSYESDTLIYYDFESYQAGFRTGESFGCIHFKGDKQ